jgi:hypothetical protein
MVRSLADLENLISHRRKQTVGEWTSLIKSITDSMSENVRIQTGLPKDARLSFEAYQKWVRSLGRVKGWNVERSPEISEASSVRRTKGRIQETVPPAKEIVTASVSE